jgi:hypothetical protein
MKRPVRPVIGIIALIVAIIGVGTSVFSHEIAERIQPTPPTEEKIADFAVRVKDAVVAKLKDRDAAVVAAPKVYRWHTTIPRIALALGILGLIGASASYLRGERRHFAVSAAGFGMIALAWQALMISLGVVFVLIIIFAILGLIGIDISI